VGSVKNTLKKSWPVLFQKHNALCTSTRTLNSVFVAIENWHPLFDCRKTQGIEWCSTVVKALVSGQYTLDSWNPFYDC
jgi:hypothetical protein